MRVINDISTKAFNTFGIDLPVKTFIEIEDKSDLEYLDVQGSFHILGGGSNVLLTRPLDKPLVHINNKGIKVLIDKQSYSLVEFSAGENWHEAVMWAIDKNLGGIENLSLIPGRCGAAPMQNIGAYGVEIKDVLHSVKAFDLQNRIEMTFHNDECGFAYRTSYFKTKWKDRFIISSIILRLNKPGYHTLNMEYGAIRDQLAIMGKSENPDIRDISNAVIEIRKSKLPDPSQIGNAGSFFKNPVVSDALHDRLKERFPGLVSYPAEEGMKLAAGWLIDQCGLKGYSEESGAGIHDRQALVLTRKGEATGADILQIAEMVKKTVSEKFGVELEEEVNIWR